MKQPTKPTGPIVYAQYDSGHTIEKDHWYHSWSVYNKNRLIGKRYGSLAAIRLVQEDQGLFDDE